MAARGEAQADVEVSTLVVPAWRLRWRAPELALVLGERAVALASARRDEVDRLRAEALVVFASNRMGRGVRIADRALDALQAAEAAGERETAWRLRVELADSARSVGAPLTGFAAVRPVLEADDVPPGLRATALVQASECLVSVGRGVALTHALDEADGLYQADPMLDHDTTLLHRGLLRAAAAGQHRRWGDLQAAVAAAREGLGMLDRLKEPATDNGQVQGRLTVELVCALMDLNKPGEASEAGTPLLERPVRAPSAFTAGWLRLALATRVHLPAGRVDQARDLLRDAADSAERHQLDTLLAESLLALAHVHEVAGDLAEALANLRSAHAAERRRARAVYAVRARLAAEFSGAHRQPPGGLHDDLSRLLRTATPAAPTTPDPDLAPEVKQQLRQWRPVQMHRNEGVRVKRSRRAAEDMTVEGISAARAHAADRWRLVQPFGDTDGTSGSDEGGRRRAPDTQSPQPTQGRPEHARSGQARPIQPPAQPPNVQPPVPPPAAQPPAAQPPAAQSPVPPPAAQPPTVQSPVVQSPAPQPAAQSPTQSSVQSPAAQPTPPPVQSSARLPVQAPGEPSPSTPAAPAVLSGPSALSEPSTAPGATTPPAFPPPPPPLPPSAPLGAHVTSADPVEPTVGGADQASTAPVSTPAPAAPAAPPVPAAPAAPAVPSPEAGGAMPARPASIDPDRQAALPTAPTHVGDVGQVAAGASDTTGVSGRPMGGAGFGGGGFGILQQESDEPAAGEGSERSVPAAGLIAAAGAVRSGRRRAAREVGQEEGEGSSEQGSDSNVLDTLKAAGLLDPQRAGGRRRAPDADADADAGEGAVVPEQEPVRESVQERESVERAEPQPSVEADMSPRAGSQPESPPEAQPEAQPAAEPAGPQQAEQAPWRVEAPSRLRNEVPPPVDMFDSPTMVQPVVRDDVPPVGLGAAFVKGPVIPTARVPEPPDFPLPPVLDFPAAIPSTPGPIAPGPIAPELTEKIEVPPVFPAADVDLPVVDEPRAQPQVQGEAKGIVESESGQVVGAPEPGQVPPVALSEPVAESIAEPVIEPVAEPVVGPAPVDMPPAPPTSLAQFGPTSFLSAADFEHDDAPTVNPTANPSATPAEHQAPVAEAEAQGGEEGAKEPFVTAVVVGGKTIDLPAIVVEPPAPSDTPSATRASRRHKSDLSLAELLAEALVAYEDARREDEAAGRVDPDEATVPISPVGKPTPHPDNETTAPIQRVDPAPRFDTWTLPEA